MMTSRDSTTKPEGVDPEDGTDEQDGTPVENPAG